MNDARRTEAASRRSGGGAGDGGTPRAKVSGGGGGAPASGRVSSDSGASRPHLAFRLFSALIGLLLVAGLVYGIGWGLPPLRDYTNARLLADTSDIKIDIAWPSSAASDAERSGSMVEGAKPAETWLPKHVQADLSARVAGVIASSRDALDASCLRLAGEALLESGWASRVLEVRRERDRIRIQAQWRVPWAVVRWRGRDQLVARDGAVLPEIFDADASGFRVIEGVAQEPPRRDATRAELAAGIADPLLAGETWPGEDLRDALALIDVLSRQPWWDQVRGIDVADRSGTDRSTRLVILTRFGGRIVWGAAPDAFRPWEQTVDVKLQRLTHLATTYGRIDAGERVVYIAGERILVEPPPSPAVAQGGTGAATGVAGAP